MNRDLMYRYYQNEIVNPRSRLLSSSESSEKKYDNNNESEKEEAVCNCNRSPETILCKGCGKSFVGRKRVLCKKHRNTIHLMDFSFCVFCKKRLE